jgi:hypothetical protein
MKLHVNWYTRNETWRIMGIRRICFTECWNNSHTDTWNEIVYVVRIRWVNFNVDQEYAEWHLKCIDNTRGGINGMHGNSAIWVNPKPIRSPEGFVWPIQFKPKKSHTSIPLTFWIKMSLGLLRTKSNEQVLRSVCWFLGAILQQVQTEL